MKNKIVKTYKLKSWVKDIGSIATYHGCGEAWAAISPAGEVMAISYRDITWYQERHLVRLQATNHSIDHLKKLGRVAFGIVSCFEFNEYAEPGRLRKMLKFRLPEPIIKLTSIDRGGSFDTGKNHG